MTKRDSKLVADVQAKIEDAEKLFNQLVEQRKQVEDTQQQLIGRITAYRELVQLLTKEEPKEPNKEANAN